MTPARALLQDFETEAERFDARDRAQGVPHEDDPHVRDMLVDGQLFTAIREARDRFGDIETARLIREAMGWH